MIDGMIDLTATQLGMLLQTGSPWADLEQVCARMPGLEASALRAAWERVALRHDILRLCIARDGDGLPQARIAAQGDWEFLTPPDALEDYLQKDRARGFPLDGAAPWRVALLAPGQDGATMVWSAHHALVDGESMALILRDLGLVLQGADLPDPPPSFADARAAITPPDAAAEARLSAYLADPPEGTLLAPALPAQAPSRRVLHQAQLDGGLSTRLGEQARGMGGTSLNMVQAAWALTLSRWCGQGDVVMGIVQSGRASLPRHRETAGCLINTLPLRVRVAAQPSLAALIATLRADTLMLRQSEHFPAARLSQGPVSETIVMYARHSLSARLCELDPWWTERAVTLREEGSAPVTLAVYDGPQMRIDLEHDPERLPRVMAARLLEGFCMLLDSLSRAAPDAPLSALAMLSLTEEKSLRALGTPANPALPPLPCIWRWFATQDGTRPAVIAEGESLTHAELRERAEAIARLLAAQGLGAGDIIALALPRSPDFVAAMLACLRLGAAFLPIDAAFPAGAVARMLQDSGARALLTLPGRAPGPEGFAGKVVHLTDAPGAQPLPDLPEPDAGRGAYVIFTSGSTGRPKAVLGLTGALCAHAAAAIRAFDLGPDDRVLQFAGLSFDVMLEEVFPTLLAGGAVVLRDDDSAGSIEHLMELCTRHGVSVTNLPASFWAVLVDALEAGTKLPPGLRLMISGSEKIDTRMLARWRAAAPGIGFVNGYGPTETTITATALILPPGAPLPQGDVPIGHPMDHAQVVILAPDGSPTPLGQTGMLWIGGPAVTGGYLNAPQATAERFAPDPAVPGARRYNTGDRARWREDGQIDFLGRMDRQIKLRGYRIDLQQIEEELHALPGVKQAHIALRGERLIGWLLCAQAQDCDAETLRARLAAQLPAHMLPELVVVDGFATTPNGKIDSAALPLPDAAQPLPGAGPIDPLTQTIADLMAEVLMLERVDVDASFPSLGGDSLRALKLAARIERDTGQRINATDLYSHPSARALAQMLLEGSGKPRFIVPIQPQGSGTTFFAVHVLGRKEELFTPLAAALGPERPVLGLTVGLPKSLDDIDVERTAEVYFTEIQTHYPEGPIALGAVSMAAYFAYELAQRLLAAGRDVRLLAIFDAAGPEGRESIGALGKAIMHARLLRERGLAHLREIVERRRQRQQAAHEIMDPDALTIDNLVSANVAAVNRYKPQSYPRKLTVFRADQAVWDSPRAIRSGLGWASVAAGGVEVLDVPGDHLTILAPENVEAVARHIAARL